jgi:3-oxoacyl-[acyl-carrier protein] reductase
MSGNLFSKEFKGQCVVVFGAGGGIGKATAQLLGSRGATIVCVDRDLSTSQRTAEMIVGEGGRASGHFADIAEAATVAEVFDAVVKSNGQIHAVINSAGITGTLGLRSHEVPIDDFDRVFKVNLRGALIVSQLSVTHMLKFGYGRIAHVASIAGKEGNPRMISYSSSKAGMIGMVKSLGKEYAEDGITVNALAPAVIQTAFLDEQPPEVVEYMTDRIPMKRTGTMLEAAQMLAWMISPACSFTTGFTFDLSGGRATY